MPRFSVDVFRTRRFTVTALGSALALAGAAWWPATVSASHSQNAIVHNVHSVRALGAAGTVQRRGPLLKH